MTNVIILGEKPQKGKRKIEFTKYLNRDLNFDSACSPSQWENVEFICENYCDNGLDLMFAYDEDRDKGCLFLGHFNDGIV
jgi:hypothetical protein